MNIKAERIEQVIQIVNRNLQLVMAGQSEGVTPIERHQLQKVDTVIFGHDKFAFEMVHFVKSAMDHFNHDGSIRETWELQFVLGLESLLVECAVVNDDIERDCFVSRVYCWFTEKLTERRELPRKIHIQMEEFKASVKASNDNSHHTLKALEMYKTEDSLEHIQERNNHQIEKALFEHQTGSLAAEHNEDPLNVPDQKSRFGARKVPMYVRHGFPAVATSSKNENHSFLPKIPGAEENYGMMYNKPETEAEKNMQELWMARRRQEAFDWKTKQHLAIVMDRLALHKSRMESDSLRRQESGNLLKVRPTTATDRDESPRKTASRRSRNRNRETTSANATSRPFRPSPFQRVPAPKQDDPDSSPERRAPPNNAPFSPDSSTQITMTKGATQAEVSVPKPSRTSVVKPTPTPKFKPMKFTMDLPDTFKIPTNDTTYLQQSDSDDDDKPDRPSKTTTVTKSGGDKGNKKGGKAAGGAVAVNFKHERPVDRERPVSARHFRQIAENDPEMKVLYRNSNYRRMPLTSQHEQWLDDRETERIKKSNEASTKLAEAFAAKADKGKGKKDEKKDKKKDAKAAPAEPEKPKSIYKNADHFMSVHFPNFEGDDDMEAIGPMRHQQLTEVARILGCCEDDEVVIKESVLRKALLIPQDKPEAVCLEELREEKEGLMLNPNPKEMWRQVNIAGGKSGKKGKKGKKK